MIQPSITLLTVLGASTGSLLGLMLAELAWRLNNVVRAFLWPAEAPVLAYPYHEEYGEGSIIGVVKIEPVWHVHVKPVCEKPENRKSQVGAEVKRRRQLVGALTVVGVGLHVTCCQILGTL